MMREPSEAAFLADVQHHQMQVLRDDGLYRHLRFRKPGEFGFDQSFDLLTWPGSLCFTGDMGTYVFSRVDDMFEFFRLDRRCPRREGVAINPGYWGEKLQSVDRIDGYKRFSLEDFKQAARACFHNLTKDTDAWPPEKRRELQEALEERVFNAEDEHEAVQAIREFSHPGAEDLFADFGERSLMRYSRRFMWCCYAVSWGVQVYDERERVAVADNASAGMPRERERAA